MIILANESIHCTDVNVLSDRHEVFTLFAIMVWDWVKVYHPILGSPPIHQEHALNRLRQFHRFLDLHFNNITKIRAITKSILIRVPTQEN